MNRYNKFVKLTFWALALHQSSVIAKDELMEG